jgi:hypothetical protein
MSYVVRCRYCQPEGIGFLDAESRCTQEIRDAKVFEDEAEAWLFANVSGEEVPDDCWVEEKGQVLIDHYVRAEREAQKADRALEAHFRPLVEAALAKKDFELAKSTVSRMCDSVAKVFLLDTIRTAKSK